MPPKTVIPWLFLQRDASLYRTLVPRHQSPFSFPIIKAEKVPIRENEKPVREPEKCWDKALAVLFHKTIWYFNLHINSNWKGIFSDLWEMFNDSCLNASNSRVLSTPRSSISHYYTSQFFFLLSLYLHLCTPEVICWSYLHSPLRPQKIVTFIAQNKPFRGLNSGILSFMSLYLRKSSLAPSIISFKLLSVQFLFQSCWPHHEVITYPVYTWQQQGVHRRKDYSFEKYQCPSGVSDTEIKNIKKKEKKKMSASA